MQLRNLARLILLLTAFYSSIGLAAINILAAENFYGSVAKELGGDQVNVTTILNNPNQDPHLFTITPATMVQAEKADIIIFNGGGYDPWMESIIKRYHRPAINVAKLIQLAPKANPHIWFDPTVMPKVANALTDLLVKLDPEHADLYRYNLLVFKQHYSALDLMIQRVRDKFSGTPVIATEPVYQYMANALGFKMYGLAFQQSMMNDVPPSMGDMRDFDNNLTQKRVKLLIYNSQVQNPFTQRLRALAEKNGIPIFGVTEMMPKELPYADWIEGQMIQLEKILGSKDAN